MRMIEQNEGESRIEYLSRAIDNLEDAIESMQKEIDFIESS